MQVFEMVTLIVLIVVSGRIIQQVFNLKEKGRSQPDLSQQYSQQIAQLEERVKVLEAIVSDGNYDLKKKFADLN